MRWVARLAVRRVVWIIVGILVFAALSAVGVKAASPFTEVVPSANVSLTSGSYASVMTVTPEAGTYKLTAFALLGNCSIAQTTNARLVEGTTTVVASTALTMSGNGFAWNLTLSAVITAAGGVTYDFQVRPQCSGAIVYKSNAYLSNEGPSTRMWLDPVGDGGGVPALDQEDKDRLDRIAIILTAGFTLLIFGVFVSAARSAKP